MDTAFWTHNIFYILCCFFIIYPPDEMERLGWTIEQIFAKWIGTEHANFILYHQRRISANMFCHALLPVYYIIAYRLKFHVTTAFDITSKPMLFVKIFGSVIETCCFTLLLIIILKIRKWHQTNWRQHSITKTLLKFCNDSQTLSNIITQINSEYLSELKYHKRLNPISRLIITNNWIIKTSLYKVHFAYQADCILRVIKTSTYNVSENTTDRLQMVTILIDPNRLNVPLFHIDINALEFANLQEEIQQQIIIPPNVHFRRNITDHFIDVFKEQISLNGIYKVTDEIQDKCFACMVNEPNIKIHKQCSDNNMNNNNNRCTNCKCIPMWCADCLGRWFAMRQVDYRYDVWLEQKCSCPMCRATFCVLDVLYIECLNPSRVTQGISTSESLDEFT